MSLQVTAIILTFNSENSIEQVIQSCQQIVDKNQILVVDSFSSDRTLDIAKMLGCQVVQHPFENYSKQRNWAQAYAQLDPEAWVLHVDSDEIISPELANSIRAAIASNSRDIDGYLLRRLSYFLGHPIRYGYLNPSWHLRLFKASKGLCEDRLYDQHFVVPGKTQKLEGFLLDLQLTTVEQWIASHNRWSSAEAIEISQLQAEKERSQTLPASLWGDKRMQNRWLKTKLYYQTPLLFRAFVFFIYSYFFRLGFLDGKIGLIYHVLQTFWFRFLIDSKLMEMQLSNASKPEVSHQLLNYTD